MIKIGLLSLALVVSGCANFPCSPQNLCAPGDGGAAMRDAARVVVYSQQQPYYYQPQPAYTPNANPVVCRRWGTGVNAQMICQ